MATDPHPRDITFEFEREKLRRYLRVKWFLSWTLAFGGLSAFIGFGSNVDALQRIGHPSPAQIVTACWRFGGATAAGLVLGVVLYLVFSHVQAATHARTASLQVEGAFLRLRQGGAFKTDRKLHFRAILDYSVLEGPLQRRFGLKTLRMTTPAGAQAMLLAVPGLRDCEAVRDQLAEIDAAREHSPA